ncbi:MAG TPA: serine hydrolase domain-containing protein, partial [Verrucomicrobiae bacterium]|nr:serine hydrolase domain-containing protein [Verrucomicrobiae bacterium]
KAIETSTPTTIAAIVEDRKNELFAKVTLVTQAAAPYQIVSIDLAPTPAPAAFAPPPMSQGELVAALRDRAQQLAGAGAFSGAVLLAKDGRPIFEQAYGLADREHDVANTLETRFRIGSMNKMFTAVAVLQLVQAGKIDLDAPLGTYLTDYPNKDLASQVTIAELLDHTGGTGDIFGPQFDAHRLQLRTLQDYEKLYGARGLAFKPGTRWEYSNYGFVLLGLVIEKVSGESYYDFVREHVYVPAGMTSTGSEPEDRAVPNRSIGYTENETGKLVPNTGTLPYRGSSAGGGYSTVGDLLSFANALQQNKLLDARYTQLLTTGKVDTPGGGQYAYGFGDRTINGVRCFGHNGGAPGMSGDLEICPGPGYVVAVLANLDPPAGDLSGFVLARLPRQ